MNVGELVRRSCLYHAERIAFVHGDQCLTYRKLGERINRLSNALLSLGLQKGDRIAILSKNRPHIIEAVFACYKAGLITVPLNARLAMAEVMHMLANSGTAALILGHEFVDAVEKARACNETGFYSVRHVIATANPGATMHDYETLLANASPDEPGICVHLDDVASLNYTSGTTGTLKAAILTHRNRICMAQKQLLIPGIDVNKNAVIAYVSPLTHGGYTMVLPVMLRGGRGIILPHFDVEELLKTIEKERVTHLLLVPTMINMMLSHADLKKYDLSSLRTIFYAASPMPVERIKQALEAFGPVLIQGYGCTESSALITYLPKEDHIADGNPKHLKRLESCGVPMMTCDVRVVNEDGNDTAPGEVGEIIERGDDTMMGYWQDPDLTAETLKNGWLHTGDLAAIDEDGYLYLVDRKTDMIISGGYNIYPSEVENVLYRHPAVYEASVIGVPDDLWGEAVKAVVVLKEDMDASAEDLIEFCKKHLASHKKPKTVDFVADLPKNSSGKIVHRLLRERYRDISRC
jgi:acyl-CoA synthetase (AMP-forming)/AMP-acid ligase II